jgi:hypothetical protein
MSDPIHGNESIPSLALRPRDAARALSVSQRTLWDWTKSGIVPFVRVGHVTMYPIRDLERWLSEKAARQPDTAL